MSAPAWPATVGGRKTGNLGKGDSASGSISSRQPAKARAEDDAGDGRRHFAAGAIANRVGGLPRLRRAVRCAVDCRHAASLPRNRSDVARAPGDQLLALLPREGTRWRIR